MEFSLEKKLEIDILKNKRSFKLALFDIGIRLILIAKKNSYVGKLFTVLAIIVFLVMIIY